MKVSKKWDSIEYFLTQIGGFVEVTYCVKWELVKFHHLNIENYREKLKKQDI